MTAERPLMQEFAVIKDSHFRTPRTLAECQFDDTGPSIGRPARRGFFDRQDVPVMLACAAIALVGLVLYIAGGFA